MNFKSIEQQEEPEYVNVPIKYFSAATKSVTQSKAIKLPPPPQHVPMPPVEIVQQQQQQQRPPLPQNSPPRSKSASPVMALAANSSSNVVTASFHSNSSPFKQITATENIVSKIISDLPKR